MPIKKTDYVSNITLKKQANKKTIDKYIDIDKNKKANIMNGCFIALYIENYKHKSQELYKTKSNPLATCKNKFCHICSYIKSKKTFVKSYLALEQMKADKIDFIGYHLTLTIKNPTREKVFEDYDKMNKAFRNFIQNFNELNQYLVGWQCGREISQSKEAKGRGEFHPHIHCLLLLKPEFHNPINRNNKITKEQFREKWKKSCEYYNVEAFQIDFKKIKSKSDFINLLEEEKDIDPFLAAISEVAKYPAKPSDIQKMSNEDFNILDNLLHKKRMFSSGGLLKEYLKKNIDNEILHISDYELINILFANYDRNKYITKELTEQETEDYFNMKEVDKIKVDMLKYRQLRTIIKK